MISEGEKAMSTGNGKSKSVKFILDGKEVEALDGETIWQVAKRQGIDIPHLCYSPEPGYRADGNCRACMIAKLGSLAKAGTVEEAVAFGDVLFIAVPYGAIPQIGKDYSARMKGKVMLDACNAVSTRDGAVADEVEQNGIGVTTQKYFPGVRIVRAFNTMLTLLSKAGDTATRRGDDGGTAQGGC